MFYRQLDGDGRSERLAEIHETFRIDVRAGQEIASRGPRIEPEPFLGWRSWIVSVAAIVEQEYGDVKRCERIGKDAR